MTPDTSTSAVERLCVKLDAMCSRPNCHCSPSKAAATLRALVAERDALKREIQGLRGSNARRSLELSLVENLIDDPAYETTSIDEEYRTGLHDKVQAHVAELARVTEEQDALRKDAERYRWVRNTHFPTVEAVLLMHSYDAMDAAIDAAIAREKP